MCVTNGYIAGTVPVWLNAQCVLSIGHLNEKGIRTIDLQCTFTLFLTHIFRCVRMNRTVCVRSFSFFLLCCWCSVSFLLCSSFAHSHFFSDGISAAAYARIFLSTLLSLSICLSLSLAQHTYEAINEELRQHYFHFIVSFSSLHWINFKSKAKIRTKKKIWKDSEKEKENTFHTTET